MYNDKNFDATIAFSEFSNVLDALQGILKQLMPIYEKHLKLPARKLRSQQTEAEQRLWAKIRCKQLLGIQFYRQRPIRSYIVDFYAPATKLVIEVDGSQHYEAEHAGQDRFRDGYLNSLGINVLRFDNRQVMTQLDEVVEQIYQRLLCHRNPP